jgi:hypothetical protein
LLTFAVESLGGISSWDSLWCSNPQTTLRRNLYNTGWSVLQLRYNRTEIYSGRKGLSVQLVRFCHFSTLVDLGRVPSGPKTYQGSPGTSLHTMSWVLSRRTTHESSPLTSANPMQPSRARICHITSACTPTHKSWSHHQREPHHRRGQGQPHFLPQQPTCGQMHSWHGGGG